MQNVLLRISVGLFNIHVTGRYRILISQGDIGQSVGGASLKSAKVKMYFKSSNCRVQRSLAMSHDQRDTTMQTVSGSLSEVMTSSRAAAGDVHPVVNVNRKSEQRGLYDTPSGRL